MGKATFCDGSKSQVSAAPNFVLSILATCSSAVPATGKQGEATLSDQLSRLLEDKANMAVDELDLLYRYRHGFSITDALNFIGFDGKIQEFFDEQKRFCLREGHVSLKTAGPEEPTKIDAAVLAHVQEDCAKGLDDETTSVADTASTTDEEESCHPDSDSDVDITGWHSLGNRLVAALGSPSLNEETDVDAAPWKVLGDRVAAAISASDDEEGEDISAWHDVGTRFLTACNRSRHEDEQDLSPDATEWRSVGIRVLRGLDSLGETANECRVLR